MTRFNASAVQLENFCVERRRAELLLGVKRRLRHRVRDSEFSQCMEWLARAGMF